MEKFTSIILLTDFSEPAKNAIKYAVDAFGEEVEYNLINAYYARTSSATLLDLNDMLAKESLSGLESEIQWMKNEYPNLNLSVFPHSIFGSPVDAIKKLAIDHDHDLVIMGTKGASGVESVLFGSVASVVIRSTIVPVISVPPNCSFTGFGTLVFATDGQEIFNNKVVDPIEKLQDKFNTDVTVFSVDKPGQHSDLESLNLGLKNAKYATVEDEDVAGAVTRFCQEKNADLLAILPKHTGFFDRLFHKSVSKQLIEQAQMPILGLENV
ncbi:MAG: universal stress protein [Crocinitomicaceae bacterium]|nr:universal stress protein [Crocinitomicaceae bacterium]